MSIKATTLLTLLVLGGTPGCKSGESITTTETPHHPLNTDTYWSKGSTTKKITAQMDATTGLIDFIDEKGGKKGFTKSMPFSHIAEGEYQFVNEKNNELVYQGNSGNISMSFDSTSASIFLPLDGYRIMESFQPSLSVRYSRPESTPTQAPEGNSLEAQDPAPEAGVSPPAAVPPTLPTTPRLDTPGVPNLTNVPPSPLTTQP